MSDLLPDFPTDDVTLAAVEHALGGSYTLDDEGLHELVGADYTLDQLLDFLAGIDRTNEAILERLSENVYFDPRPHYHYTDIIRALIAEVQLLRAGEVSGE